MSVGIATIVAVGPHIQANPATERKMATGVTTIRRDSNSGCTKFASTVLIASKIAGGASASRMAFDVANPTTAEARIMVVGPMTGMKFATPNAKPQSSA